MCYISFFREKFIYKDPADFHELYRCDTIEAPNLLGILAKIVTVDAHTSYN